jgi:transposase
MIIFFGTRQVVRDDERPSAMQQCPRCGQYAQFKSRSSRTYFHIFWIPLLPIGGVQSLIECQNCHARFVA